MSGLTTGAARAGKSVKRRATTSRATGDLQTGAPSKPSWPAPIERERARHEMRMQCLLAKWICTALGVISAATLAIFFLQGFGAGGFKLSEPVLHWIGAATVGEIGTLATLVYSTFFTRKR